MSLNFINFNAETFLQTAGYLGLFLMMFSETGLLIGLLLPGESLLFTAGLLSSLGYLNIWLVILITAIAAVLADNVGYALGNRYGPRIFRRKNSLIFNEKYVSQAENFYRRHGGKTVIAARFIPFVRTLAPVFAGVGKMPYRTFILYNFIGGASWALIIPLAGYLLGKSVPNITNYLVLMAIAIVVISMIPAIFQLIQRSRLKSL